MRRTLCLSLLALTAACAAVPGARAADVVGIADQSAGMFYSPWYQKLDVKVSRLIVSYDAVLLGTFEVADIDRWMAAARASKVEPLVAFNFSRGCFDLRDKKKICRLPSVKHYRRAVVAFRNRYPDVNVYSPWNEINHYAQPTYDRPDRAAAYYNEMRKLCKGCTIIAADVLDQVGMTKYLKRFQRYAKGKPRLWGLHNYQDTNNYTTSGTREMLRAVKGDIWLTETGGIVQFGRRKYNPKRAAKATKFMFKLAGSSKRVKRLYIYQWTGQPRTARWDAGLTHPDGSPRPAYDVVRRHLKRPGGNPDPPPVPPPPPPPPPEPSPQPTPSPTPAPTPCVDPFGIICPGFGS